MRKIAVGAVLVSGIVAAGIAWADELRVTSTDVTEGGKIKTEQVLKGSGCTGGDISPALRWSGAPAGTKSFAVTMFDPDAEVGKGWWHWIIYDIPPNVTGLPKNAGDTKRRLAPKGVDGQLLSGSPS